MPFIFFLSKFTVLRIGRLYLSRRHCRLFFDCREFHALLLSSLCVLRKECYIASNLPGHDTIGDIPKVSGLHSSLREGGMVEPDGIEPTTSCLQSRRSPD